MLLFGERGKPENPGKNLSEQKREPTNSIHIQQRIDDNTPEPPKRDPDPHRWATKGMAHYWNRLLYFRGRRITICC